MTVRAQLNVMDRIPKSHSVHSDITWLFSHALTSLVRITKFPSTIAQSSRSYAFRLKTLLPLSLYNASTAPLELHRRRQAGDDVFIFRDHIRRDCVLPGRNLGR